MPNKTKEKKKYYSSYKPYFRVKRRYICYNLLVKFVKLFNKTTVTEETPLPDEPVVIMGNHAREYGPIAMILTAKRKYRGWTHSNFLYVKTVPGHMMKDMFANAKKLGWFFLKILTFLLAPLVTALFRATDGIPVYKDMRVKTTFNKTLATLKEGHDVLIFPESIIPDPENEYVNTFQRGAFKLFDILHRKGDRVPLLCPVYFCKDLNTVSYGAPIAYDITVPAKEAMEKMANALSAAITRLASALPKHNITPYGEMPEDITKIEKYMSKKDHEVYGKLKEQNDALQNKDTDTP